MREAAVIDVGSNSVRLVAYRLDGRSVTPFLNEKVMAGLGRNLATTGKLSPTGIEVALKALSRFAMLIDGLGLKDVYAVATAAVRDAKDGAKFAERVRNETGIKLRVIEGAEEARLSALGVLAGAPEATGVVGDLGGSSLELVEVGPNGPGRGETWPLGPLSMMTGEPFDAERVARVADAALTKSAVLRDAAPGSAFHAVGGAWRALGRIDIALRRHPIGVLHHHQMTRAEVLRVAEFVHKQSRKSLERFEEAAAKRADSLPYASVVLERVMALGAFDRVILSSYGLREGLLVQNTARELRPLHPLVAGAESFAGGVPRTRAFGAALEKWLAPAFEALPAVFDRERDRVLRAAAARLADIGAALHPEQRGELIYDLVLMAPFSGVSHAERAFLAASVHHRYTRAAPDKKEAYARLLSEDQRRAAAALGAALRLGADLSGRAEPVLGAFDLLLSDGRLTLRADRAHGRLITEQAMKRLDALASVLGVVAGVSQPD
ncbi:MAG: Ppx/GppA family phosphatase [Hyphomonadaceae bacterium]|nr:Ppx/GppA family phosphatase [Hyphomonadaceae bacterium]